MRYLLMIAVLILVGCGAETRTESENKREMVSESRTVTKEVTVHTPTAEGGFIVEKTITTETTGGERTTSAAQENTRTAPDAATRGLIATGARIAGHAVSAASGGGIGGEGVATLITALITAGVSAYGAAKHTQAKQLREERDFHKDDAEKGWKHAMEGRQQA
jgi:hypothetical protein